jgi:hypothetical protein
VIKSIVTSLILSFALVGCVHLGSVSTSSIPADRSRPVEVEGFQFLPFLISFSTSYVNELALELAEQCPNGKVEGVLTKQELLTYFPLFAHAYRITASGYCVSGVQ